MKIDWFQETTTFLELTTHSHDLIDRIIRSFYLNEKPVSFCSFNH